MLFFLTVFGGLALKVVSLGPNYSIYFNYVTTVGVWQCGGQNYSLYVNYVTRLRVWQSQEGASLLTDPV